MDPMDIISLPFAQKIAQIILVKYPFLLKSVKLPIISGKKSLRIIPLSKSIILL